MKELFFLIVNFIAEIVAAILLFSVIGIAAVVIHWLTVLFHNYGLTGDYIAALEILHQIVFYGDIAVFLFVIAVQGARFIKKIWRNIGNSKVCEKFDGCVLREP